MFRVSDTSLKTVLIKFRENTWDVCKVLKVDKDSPFGECMFIFNNVFKQSRWGYDTILNADCVKKHFSGEYAYRFGRVMSISPNELNSFASIIYEITLLPDSFESDYEKFLKENAKMINSLKSSFDISVNDIRIKRMYIYSDGSKNFFQWAVNAYYKNGISLSTIKSILQWNESYKQLAKNLSKGTITAYTSRDSIAPLLKELSELRKEKRI